MHDLNLTTTGPFTKVTTNCVLVSFQSHYTLPDWREKSNRKVARVKVGVHPPKSKRKKARLVYTQVDEREVKVEEHHKGTMPRSVYSKIRSSEM